MNSLDHEVEKIIAGRLRQVRESYGDKIGVKKAFTQSQIGKMCGISQNSMHRLETDLNGTAKNLVKLLNFYEEAGFNSAWVMTLKNDHVSFTKSNIEDDDFMEPVTAKDLLDISLNKFKYSEQIQADIIKEIAKVLQKHL